MHTYSHIICAYFTFVYIYFNKNDATCVFYSQRIVIFLFEQLQRHRCALLLRRVQESGGAAFPAAGQVRSSHPASRRKESRGLAKSLHSCTLHAPAMTAVIALCLPDAILWEYIFQKKKPKQTKTPPPPPKKTTMKLCRVNTAILKTSDAYSIYQASTKTHTISSCKHFLD